MPYEIGTILNGKVNNITERGVYVTIDNDTFGFLPNKKMPSLLGADGLFSGTKYDFVLVAVEKIRSDGMLLLCDVSYWMKQQSINEFKERYEPGTIFPCEVKKVSSSRAIILVDNTIEGTITKELLGWNAINKVSDVLYEGEPINAVYVGEENGRLLFGMKFLQEKPYDEALYDLSLEDLLKHIGHCGTEFIGECQKHGDYLFLENLYSANSGEEGKILVDPKYGYNLRAIIVSKNCGVAEGGFYKFHLVLLSKDARLERNQLFQFKAEGIQPVPRNPFSDDVLKAFKKNISPATNITAAHLLAEVGKNMYSSKDRMFFELVQNADDASSETGVSVSVKTEGDYLTVVHNGFSFDREDFEAITSAANGTKKANENKTGYKGIGFKSVFTDSEEVLIRTGGYQFKYQKTHPVFSDFEKFYFFVNELSKDEQKARFLERFSSERARFAGVNDIPWQLEPIWVKRENFPAISAFKSNANVAIALKFGDDKIEGEKGYRRAIEDVIDNPKFMLFLRNTNRIDFNERTASKGIDGNRIILKNSFGSVRLEIFERKDFSVDSSDQALFAKGFDLKRKIENEENGKIIEASFVNSRNQEYENIPKKLAISQSTGISFAVRCSNDEGGHINPDTECSGISMFAFLPTLVKEFKFPFYINANFVLDPPRQHILSDNPWNCFLMGEIGELVVRWCAELSEQGETAALNVLPAELFNESESDIAELAEAFNSRYKKALGEIPFVLCSDSLLHSLNDVLIDKTGLSKIIGQVTFCRALDSTKHLPSTSIDCSILDKELFSTVEKVEIKQLASAASTTTELNTWYSTAPEDSKAAFLTWLDKHSSDLSAIIPSLRLFKVGHAMCAANELTIESGKLVCTESILPIKDVFEKLGFSCSEAIKSDSSLWPFAPKQSGKKVYEALAAKDNLSTLSTDEKLLLVKHLADLENVGEAAISSLSMFKNLKGEVHRMDEMMSFIENAPEWLKPFVVSKEENSSDIQKYLVAFDSAFEKLILPKLSSVEADIKTIYEYFRWSDARLSKEVIDLLFTSDKFASFIDVVQDLDKDTREYYLQKDWRLDLSIDKKYSKESAEYKMLTLAINTLDDPSVVSSRVFVGEKCLKEYSVKDNVSCTFTSNGASLSVDFSLSHLLPDYENQSGKIEDVKSLFESSLAWDKLVKSEQKKADWVEGELNKKLGIVHASYADWVTGAGNAQQYLFSVYRRRLSWTTVKGFTIDLEKESDSFVNEMMDFIFANRLAISTSPFTSKINKYFSGKYFDNDYIFQNEQLLPILEKWADSEDKKRFLVNNGVRTVNDEAILFRKAFINDEDYPGFESLSDTDRKEAIEFLVGTDIVTWPVYGDNQWKYLDQILGMRYSPLKESIELSELEQHSIEMNLPSYLTWVESNNPSIYLYDGKMPKQINYDSSETILARFSGDDYYYDTSNRKLYVDKNEDVEELLFDLSRGSKVPFNLDDYKAVFRVGMTSVSNEEIEQTQKRIESLTTELSEKEQLLMRYRQRFGDLDESPAVPPQSSDSPGENVVIRKGNSEGLSISEMAAAQLEAQRFIMQTQPQWQFPEHYGEVDDDGEPYHFSTAEIIDENGTPTSIVLKSLKAEGEPLKINTFEWSSISKDKARIFVYTGDDIKEIDVKDLVSNQPTVNISFSTENLDIEERIAAFADSLRYFKELHFDFDSFNLSRQAKSLSGMYNINDRRQGATSDSDL